MADFVTAKVQQGVSVEIVDPQGVSPPVYVWSDDVIWARIKVRRIQRTLSLDSTGCAWLHTRTDEGAVAKRWPISLVGDARDGWQTSGSVDQHALWVHNPRPYNGIGQVGCLWAHQMPARIHAEFAREMLAGALAVLAGPKPPSDRPVRQRKEVVRFMSK